VRPMTLSNIPYEELTSRLAAIFDPEEHPGGISFRDPSNGNGNRALPVIFIETTTRSGAEGESWGA
jgi:hypothetical protein